MYREAEYIDQARAFHGYVPEIMGTKLEFLACGVDSSTARVVWDSFCAELAGLNALLNRFDKDSEVSKINSSVPFTLLRVSDTLSGLIRLCKEYNTLTGGLFDITCGNAGRLEIDGDNLLSLGGGKIDFGGFAKGYALEMCRSELVEAGITDAFVNFGNSTILGLGKHPFGESWDVEVISPFTKASLRTVSLRNLTLSTSGNTPGYYGHIVNPKTGEQIKGRKVACVVSGSPLEAEVLSTAAMVADAEGLDVLRRNFPSSTIYTYNN